MYVVEIRDHHRLKQKITVPFAAVHPQYVQQNTHKRGKVAEEDPVGSRLFGHCVQ
jgi:hypothetical protein